MGVREYRPEDAPRALALWDAAAGWYRETTAVSRAEAAAALAAIGTPERRSRLPWRRPARSRESAWVLEEGDGLIALLYARIDPDLSYVVPVSRPASDEATGMAELADSAAPWFLGHGVQRYVIELPMDRPGLRKAFLPRGTALWRRQVFLSPLAERPGALARTDGIRSFRPRDGGVIRSLYAQRFPRGRPTPIPVPFVALPTTSWSLAPATALETRLWVLETRSGLAGIAGATPRGAAATGDIGPFLTDPWAGVEDRTRLLAAAVETLRLRFARRARASLPQGLEPEAEALGSLGFSVAAESDLVEVRA